MATLVLYLSCSTVPAQAGAEFKDLRLDVVDDHHTLGSSKISCKINGFERVSHGKFL